jgi:4-hydroxybenzoate polyprenyltransferase
MMLRLVLHFTKVEHTAFSLPLVLAGAWIATRGNWPPVRIFALIVTATMGARVFGMAFNRIFDRRLDALNPRTADRAMPAGQIGAFAAGAIALAGLTTYLVSCSLLNRWCLILAPVPLVPLLGYSLLKRFTSLCHYGIGLCLALAPLGAFVAAAGHIGFPAELWLFAGFVFFWMSGADIVYAMMDIQSDRINGIFSLPARWGPARALAVAAAGHGLCLAAAAAVWEKTGAGPEAAAALGVCGLALAIMYLPWISYARRFFPISTIAGIAGAMVPILGSY